MSYEYKEPLAKGMEVKFYLGAGRHLDVECARYTAFEPNPYKIKLTLERRVVGDPDFQMVREVVLLNDSEVVKYKVDSIDAQSEFQIKIYHEKPIMDGIPGPYYDQRRLRYNTEPEYALRVEAHADHHWQAGVVSISKYPVLAS